MAFVSVVIPTYNSSDSICKAIESVVQQAYEKIEIIVVDDGSTDDTETVLKPYIDQGLIYVKQQNQGPGAARNTGMNVSKGSYICFLDSDDLFLPGSVKRRAEFLDRQQNVNMVFTEVYRKTPEEKYLYNQRDDFLEKFRPAILVFNEDEYVFGQNYFSLALQYYPYIHTSSVMIRREIFMEIGGFNTKLRAGEDTDFWFRIMRGGNIGYINIPTEQWNTTAGSLVSISDQYYPHSINFYQSWLDKDLSDHDRMNIRKKISHFMRLYAYDLFDRRKMRESRIKYLHSLKYDRINFISTLKYIVLTCLPLKFQSTLKKVKDSLYGGGQK